MPAKIFGSAALGMTKAGRKQKKRNSRAQRKKRNLKKAHLAVSGPPSMTAADYIETVTSSSVLRLSPPDSGPSKASAISGLLRKDKKTKKGSDGNDRKRRTKRPDSLRKGGSSKKSAAAGRQRKPKPASGFIHGLQSFIWKSAVIVGALFLLYVYAANQSLTPYGPELEQLAKKHLGIDVSIDGDIALAMPVVRPGVVLGDVSLAGEDASGGDNLKFERVEVRLDFSSLFNGDDALQLLSVTLVGTELDVVHHAAGRSSLERMTSVARSFQSQTSELWSAISVGELALQDSLLVWRGDDGVPLATLPISRMDFWAENNEVQISLSGRVGAEAYSMGGSLQGIDAFQNGQSASLDMTGALGSTFLILSGEVSGSQEGNSEVQLQALGPDVSGLAGVFGYRDRVVPAPFALSLLLNGNLLGRMAGEIDGKFNDSEFTGTLLSNYADGPAINLNMSGSYVDLAVLRPFLTVPFDAESQEQNALTAADFVGQVDLSFQSVRAGDIDLGPGRFVVTSATETLDWLVQQGSDELGLFEVAVKQSRSLPETLSVEASADGFDFGSALSIFSDDFDAVAIASLSANLSSNADLSAPPVSTLSGDIEMIVAAERIAAFRPGLVPRDLERVLGRDLIAGSVMRDACLVTKGSMRNGRLTANSFALETENIITTGGGYLDFPSDTVKVSLRPRPKDPRKMDEAVDVEVAGKLSTPMFRTNDRGLSRGLSGSLSLNGLLSDGDGLIRSLSARPGSGPCFDGLLGY